MSDMKYIRFEDMGIIIFGSHIPHTTMKQLINDEVVSAGFVSLSDKDANLALNLMNRTPIFFVKCSIHSVKFHRRL